jgi:transcriptional/translational regulatory protein YebC/TACO1
VGGPDPKRNARLDLELRVAKAGTCQNRVDLIEENMTKETIARAIARGGPRQSGTDLNPLTYEAVLPGGISFVMYPDPGQPDEIC